MDKKEHVSYLFGYGDLLLRARAQGVDVNAQIQNVVKELEKLLIHDYQPCSAKPIHAADTDDDVSADRPSFRVKPDLQFFKE